MSLSTLYKKLGRLLKNHLINEHEGKSLKIDKQLALNIENMVELRQ